MITAILAALLAVASFSAGVVAVKVINYWLMVRCLSELERHVRDNGTPV